MRKLLLGGMVLYAYVTLCYFALWIFYARVTIRLDKKTCGKHTSMKISENS